MERIDGRKADEIRPMVAKAGVIPNAQGSGYFAFGRTIAIAAVYGPREVFPKFKAQSDKALLNTVYTMVPFSTSERSRPGRSRRSQEISMVTRKALEPAIFLEEYPKSSIDVYVTIISAEAGTRTAGINASSLALADAGIPMRDLVTAVATGKIGDEYVIDLVGKEEEQTACDLPIAMLPRTGKISLLQLDGDMPKEDVVAAITLAQKGCRDIYTVLQKALRERWEKS